MSQEWLYRSRLSAERSALWIAWEVNDLLFVVLMFAVPAVIHMSQFISGVCKTGHARFASSF